MTNHLCETDNFLVNVMEECAEVSQEASKAIRFGLSNHAPNTTQTNADRILTEYYQLTAVIEKLQRDGKLPSWGPEVVNAIKDSKIKKIREWNNRHTGES